MISLFIDTCTKYLILALYKDKETIGYYKEEANNNLSITLLPQIDKLLKNSNISINDIDKIFVVNGPGSFTGIRIGVTTAKTMAWGLKKDIYAISELEILSSVDTDKKYVVPLIDARRGYVYTGMYDLSGSSIIENRYANFNEFYTQLSTNYNLDEILFVSNDSFDIDAITPVINVWKVIERHDSDTPINPHMVNPNYLKLTEAEEKLNDKRDNG